MANIVITSSGNSIIVDFGVYSNLAVVDGRKAAYRVTDVSIIWLEKDDSIVNVIMKDAITTKHWQVSYSPEAEVFVVDTVDGVSPTDNIDLFNKLTALM
jgi:hypothetical protein